MNYCINCKHVIPPKEDDTAISTMYTYLCTHYRHQITGNPNACQLIRPNGVYDENEEYPECRAYDEKE